MLKGLCESIHIRLKVATGVYLQSETNITETHFKTEKK